MKLNAFAAALAAACLAACPALAASTTITGTTNGGASVTLGAVDNGAGGPKSPTHGVVDAAANAINPATSERQDAIKASVDQLHSDNGADGSGITQPAGGAGIRGWISGIYKAVTGRLTATLVDSAGGDATDTTHHAINVNVVAGGAGGGAVTVADGADVALGAKADSSCGSDTGTCGLLALVKRLNAAITTLNGKIDTLTTAVNGSIPAGSALIGKVGVDQTTRGTTNAVVPLSAQAIAAAQVSVGTSATQIVASRAGRRSVTIISEGTTVVRLGPSGVTTGTGAYLAGVAGASVTLETEAAVYGIVGSGSQAVSVIENY